MVWSGDKLPAAPGLYAGQLSDSGKMTLGEALYNTAAVKTMQQSILLHTFFLSWYGILCILSSPWLDLLERNFYKDFINSKSGSQADKAQIT